MTLTVDVKIERDSVMYSARHIIGRARFETQCMTPKLKLLILHLISKGC